MDPADLIVVVSVHQLRIAPLPLDAGVQREGSYTELMYGNHYDQIRRIHLYPNSFAWLLRDEI